MKPEIVIQATKRNVRGKQVKALRREGKLPAVIYGKHLAEPIPLLLDMHDSSHSLARIGSSDLITLYVDGEQYPSLVREKQRDFIYGNLLHVDFQSISMDEKLRTSVRIELIGEPPAVKEFGGILVTGEGELEIECLPADLPSIIQVDVSRLEKIGDMIVVRDIIMPENVTLLSDLDELVAHVTAPMAEEEVEVPVEVEAEPEIIEKGKVEEEEEEEKEKEK
jgi:large subunit ribosomal protein L25